MVKRDPATIRGDAVRCPFCAKSNWIARSRTKGWHKIQCEHCHRTFLLETRVTLGIFRGHRTQIL